MAGSPALTPQDVGGFDSNSLPPIDTSSYGAVLPVVYGTNRLAVKIICMPPELWVDGGSAGATGKGGGNGVNGYYQAVWLAIAEGGASCSTGRMWIDKHVFASVTTDIDPVPPPTDLSDPFEFLPGTRPQNPPADWTGAAPVTLVGVSGIGTNSCTVSGLAHNTAFIGCAIQFNALSSNDQARIIATLAPSGANDIITWTVALSSTTGINGLGIVTTSVPSNTLNQRSAPAVVPAVGPFTIVATADNGAPDPGWVSDAGVTANSGVLTLNLVAGPLANVGISCDYNATGGVYTFAAAQAGRTVRITYNLNTDIGKYSIGYSGTALLATKAMTLGNSNSMKNISIEFIGLGNGFLGDQAPDLILADAITNTQYGMGFPSQRVDARTGPDGTTASGLNTYATAVAIGLSPIFDSQKSAIEHIQWILDACNAEMVQSQGVLRFYPRGDVAVGSFTPYNTARYALTDDHMLANEGEDMIVMQRKSPAEIVNSCPIEFVDSQTPDQASQYQVSIVQDIEEPNVQAAGGTLRADGTLSLKCITKQSTAQYIARVRAQRSVYVRNTFRFKLPQQFCLLDPFDILNISDPLIGLSNTAVRILSIEENENDELEIEAEEAGVGACSTATYSTGTAQGGGQTIHLAPVPGVSPILWMPPLVGTGTRPHPGVGHAVGPAQPVSMPHPVGTSGAQGPELWVATASPAKDWGGAQVFISYDGTNYDYAGDVTGATIGVTSGSTFGQGSPVDASNTVQVDLASSLGTMASVPQAARDAGQSMCLINSGAAGELIAYQTAALVSGNKYNLTNHRRGLFGTPVGSHTAGVQFLLIDGNVLRFQLDTSRLVAGGTIYVKLASYNLARTQSMSLAQAPVYTYTQPGPGAAAEMPTFESLPYRVTFDSFDASQWDFPVSSPGILNKVQNVSAKDNSEGGWYLECSGGGIVMVNKALIAVDPNKVYCVEAIVKQRLQGTGPVSRNLYFGFAGYQADQVTQVSSFPNAGVSLPSLFLDSPFTHTWHKVYTYFSINSGISGGTVSAQTPVQLPGNVKYVRLGVGFNGAPTAAGDGTQDISSIQIYEVTPAATLSQVIVGAYSIPGGSTAGGISGPTMTSVTNDTYTLTGVPSGASIVAGTEQVSVGGLMVARSLYSVSGNQIIFASTAVPQGEIVMVTCAYQ